MTPPQGERRHGGGAQGERRRGGGAGLAAFDGARRGRLSLALMSAPLAAAWLSVDIRLCTDASCASSYADFTLADGVCTASPSGSSRVDLAAGNGAALFQAFGEGACYSTPTLYMELMLDGAIHFDPNAKLFYTAMLTQACLPPDPYLPYYSTMTLATGKGLGDVGNLDVCLFNGFQHCTIQETTTGFIAGACLPRNCGVADVVNTSSPIWSYLFLQAPIWGLVLSLGNTTHMSAFCGTQEFPIDNSAAATIACLVVGAVLVLAATLYALAVRAPKSGKGKVSAAPLPVPPQLDAMLRAASLSTTLPRLLGTAPPVRARNESAPRLAAFDGVRVLSLSLVMLGHSVFFPLEAVGFSNGAQINEWLGRAAFQILPSAEYAVDTFFVLSGALSAYLFARGLRAAFAKAAEAEGFGTAGAEASINGEGVKLKGDDATHVLLSDGDSSQVVALRAPSPAALRVVARSATATAAAWAYSCVHRYLRLVPSVGAMIAIYLNIAPLLGSGPYWQVGWQGLRTNCMDHLWTNLLFLNNVLPTGEANTFGSQCTGWLWYLAVDFQLNVVALAPLCAVFAASERAGWAALASVLVTTIALSAHRVTDRSLTFLTFNAGPDLEGDYANLFYMNPVYRAPAFLFGVGLGWVLLSWETQEAAAATLRAEAAGDISGRPLKPNSSESDEEEAGVGPSHSATTAARRLIALVLPVAADGVTPDGLASLGLAAALTLLGTLFYCTTDAYRGELGAANLESNTPDTYAGSARWTDAQQQLFTVVSRPLWALGLGVVLFLCATKRGGALAAFLGAPLWTPIATLAFGAYLYHPVVLCVFGFAPGAPPRFTATFLAFTYAATCVFSCLTAAIMYMLVEAPAAALEKLLLDGGIALARGAAAGARA